jgi:hypothetical protein
VFHLYYFILTGVHLFHVCVGMAVLTFTLTVRLVGLDFMELHSAPMPLRLAFEGYCLGLPAMLSGLYLLG